MPELPEVQTIVDGLNRQVAGAVIIDVFCDWKKMIQEPKTWQKFENMIVGKKILKLAIKMRGSSESDYRDVDGSEGGYQKIHKVYQREVIVVNLHVPCLSNFNF